MPDMWMDVDTALAEVPVNILPLTDDIDFKSREESVAYNAAGMELIWHFTTTAGATTTTVVTPTTGGAYDWAHQDGGMYTIEIPASGGASINNDTEGFGHFTGVATGVLPWRGPVIGFRAAAINNALIDGATVDVNVTAMADDVITAAKFDESTAFPLKSADTGATAVARTGADSDTLEVLSDEIAAVATTIGTAGAGLTAITGAKLHSDYDAAKSAAPAGAAMTLTAAYDAAKAAAAAGAKMDLVDAPNETAVTAIQNGLATSANQTTILNRLGAWTGNGINTVLGAFKALLSKAAAAPSDIGGTFDPTTDSTEALRERGDAAWVTATGFSTHTAADVKTAVEAVGSHLTLIKAETDKLADTLEDDGGVYRFTENALEEGPSSSGTGATLEEIEGSTVLAKEATVATVDAKVSALGASVVTVTSPVSVDAQTVTLVCGDDYYNADGRALTFTDSGGTYPAFTAGSCKFTVRDLAKGTDTETAGTIVDANTVRFELTKTATGAWTAGGKYRFDVEVTLASGHEVTVATGVVTMLAKYSG